VAAYCIKCDAGYSSSTGAFSLQKNGGVTDTYSHSKFKAMHIRMIHRITGLKTSVLCNKGIVRNSGRGRRFKFEVEYQDKSQGYPSVPSFLMKPWIHEMHLLAITLE